MATFLNSIDDVEWLKTTHLCAKSGTPIPVEFSEWNDFKSFLIDDNEDSPSTVYLFLSDDPLFVDRSLKVEFKDGGAVFSLYNGM